MTYGTSIFLIAVGAILRFAVNVTSTSVDIQTIGLILMIVGGVGLILSILWLLVWSDRARERRAVEAPGGVERVRREREPY